MVRTLAEYIAELDDVTGEALALGDRRYHIYIKGGRVTTGDLESLPSNRPHIGPQVAIALDIGLEIGLTNPEDALRYAVACRLGEANNLVPVFDHSSFIFRQTGIRSTKDVDSVFDLVRLFDGICAGKNFSEVRMVLEEQIEGLV